MKIFGVLTMLVLLAVGGCFWCDSYSGASVMGGDGEGRFSPFIDFKVWDDWTSKQGDFTPEELARMPERQRRAMETMYEIQRDVKE